MSLLSVSTSSLSFLTAVNTTAEGAVNVDLDASLVVQIGLFIVLLVTLKPLLFDPMLKLFEEREKRIDGTKSEAARENDRSAKAKAKYDAILAKARDAGAAERDVLRAKAAKEEAEKMAYARASSASTVEQGRAASAVEAKAARLALTSESLLLGRSIASRVLGREVSS